MPSEITTGKTVIILAAVVGCFAILWPRLFYPMLQSALYETTSSSLDKTAGCCDVISDTDVNAIKILTEMCGRILTKHDELDPKFLSDFEQGKMTKEVVNTCRREVLNTCGVDITSFLAVQVGLGHTYRQIMENIKTFNNSVCLQQNFGIERSLLGAARHWSQIPTKNLRQERPPHMRPDLVHAALRERGRAIPPQSNVVPRILEGRPGPIPGMRPPMGGAGHVVPAPKATQGALGILMPLYTVGIVMIFVYTMMKLLMRRNTDVESANNFQSDPNFRHYVFGDHHGEQNGTSKHHYDQHTKLVETAISGLLEEVDRQRDIVAKRAEQPSGKGENGIQAEPKREADESASVKVLNMETTASCEGGKPWTGSRPSTPSRSRPPSRPPTPLEREAATIPPPQDAQEIYLEGALPSQAQLLVAESETETHKVEEDEVKNAVEDEEIAASVQNTSTTVSVPEDADTPPVSPVESDHRKKITFDYSVKEDGVLEKDTKEILNSGNVKDSAEGEEEEMDESEEEIDEEDEESEVEMELREGDRVTFKIDNSESVNRVERLSSLDEEYLQNEIDSIIEEAVEYVQHELEAKQYLTLSEEGDYDQEGEYLEEEELEEQEGKEEDEDGENDIESDIREAIKESEKMRKSVHEKVEEVKSSLMSVAPQEKVTLEQEPIAHPLNASNTAAGKVKFQTEQLGGDEDDEEEEEMEDEELDEEEVEEEEYEDEEVEDEEEEVEDRETGNARLANSRVGETEGANGKHVNDKNAVDDEEEYEEEEIEEEEEEVDEEEEEEEIDEEEEEVEDEEVEEEEAPVNAENGKK